MKTVSFDDFPDLYTLINQNSVTPKSKYSFGDLVKGSQDFLLKYLKLLPQPDFIVAKYYYFDEMSQAQISILLGISQAAVSMRLRKLVHRLKFLIKMPSTNPIQVRRDLSVLMPEDLFEYAYYFYFERTQSRVKHFIETSQSGAANKFTQVLNYLRELKSNWGKKTEEDRDWDYRDCLLALYLEYFEFIEKNPNILSFFIKNKSKRNSKV